MIFVLKLTTEIYRQDTCSVPFISVSERKWIIDTLAIDSPVHRSALQSEWVELESFFSSWKFACDSQMGTQVSSKTLVAATSVCLTFSSRRKTRSAWEATVLSSAASAASRFQDENLTSRPLRPVPPRWSSACRQYYFRHEVRAAPALPPSPYESLGVPSRFLVCDCCSRPWAHNRR